MEYDLPLFRPPSEARPLIFQVTLGCSWNRCLFCTSHGTKKFQVRPFEEVERDVNAIDPQFLATLTLMTGPNGRDYEEKVMGGGFKLIDRKQSLQELRWFVEDLKLARCRFGTEHASNCLPITEMTLPGDRDGILRRIDMGLADASTDMLRPERMRGL